MHRILSVPLLMICAALLLVALLPRAAAQTDSAPADSFAALLQTRLRTQPDALLVVTLTTPLTNGQSLLSSDTWSLRVGVDYLCFGEPWNDGTRQHCTPFSNVAAVSFAESDPG